LAKKISSQPRYDHFDISPSAMLIAWHFGIIAQLKGKINPFLKKGEKSFAGFGFACKSNGDVL